MRRAQGYAIVTDATGNHEADTFTCGHCQKIVTVGPGLPPEDFGGFCKVCSSLICKHCVGLPCVPWEKKMELIERSAKLHRDLGLEGA